MMMDFGGVIRIRACNQKRYTLERMRMNALAVFERNVLNPNFHQLGGDRRTDKIWKTLKFKAQVNEIVDANNNMIVLVHACLAFIALNPLAKNFRVPKFCEFQLLARSRFLEGGRWSKSESSI
jgi:hypothetical protein